MNYYAQGGQAHGLKAIAQELQDMGRGGDTMLAHINPQEAALLKRMGGSGTINPATGLPEFIKIGGKIGKAIEKPFRSEGVIGKVIAPILPYAQYIAPFIPGVNAAWAAGIGALGSGFAGGGGFNLKKGIMGGMTAYGLSNLYGGLQAAGGAPAASAGPAELGVMGTEVAPSVVAETGLTVPPGAAGADIGGQLAAGNFADAASTIGENVSQGVSSLGDKLSTVGTDFSNQMGSAGEGIKNLAGLGEGTMTDAASKFTGSGASLTNTAGAGFLGYTGQEAIKEAEIAKLEADLANAKSQEEYDAIMTKIEASRQRGVEAMRNNPYMFAEGGEVPRYGFGGGINMSALMSKIKGVLKPDAISSEVPLPQQAQAVGIASSTAEKINPDQLRTYLSQMKSMNKEDQDALRGMLGSHYGFAYGGSVDDEAGMDDLSPVAMAEGGLGNLSNGLQFAKGGQPRFLSGGGDGMSDDIPATINGKQPARLADGEFVIPADVVSHLGNGSSKAGAKQLYSMMDKVRSARTGTKKQGKQINPAKFMPA